MLDELFGAKTTERILLYLTAMGEGYAAEISGAFCMSNTQTLRTVQRLEDADVIVGKVVGRARIYTLNQRWILAGELKSLLDKALIYMPIDEQQRYFGKRHKPRKKSKGI